MSDTIIKNMFEDVKKGDDFYFLGDLSWSLDVILEVLEQAKNKNIRFHWILGNHDYKFKKQLEKKIKQFNKLNTINDILEIKLTDKEGKHYPTILCHYPMFTWNKSHYNSFLLFGHHHLHTYKVDDIRRFELNGKKLNVCCEFNNYKAFNELEIIEIMSRRPDNWDLIRSNI